jgi:hypothetical protein
MYRSNQQYLQAQGRPSSFVGQIGDIPNRIHEAADAGEIGMKMMRHAQLTNGAGLRATVTIDGVWQVGSYMNMSPVLQLQGRVQCDGPGPSEPYVAVFDEVVAQLHTARMQPGVRVAVFVDPQKSRGHGDRLDPHRSARPAAARFHSGSGRAGGAACVLTSRDVEQDAQEVVWVVPHQVVGAVEFMSDPVRVVANPFI